MTINLKSILTIVFLTVLVGGTNAQLRNKFVASEASLALIDSNTLKVRGKLFKQIPRGDLNIYGFDEYDVPVYADSVYSYRLSILESEVPLDYNEYVKPYIDLYTIRKRKLASKILAWSNYYFPMIEEALDREKMPLELKYLAVIESALNPMATSPVGAAGMWQFMAPTGRIYGLQTTHIYDERRNVAKATDAAIKYLRNSYNLYGDWLLVIASYNCGPGNVNKAIKRAGGVKNFWAVQQYLPRETRGYVPAFIAAAYLMSYSSEHNIYPSEDLAINYQTDTVSIDNRYTLAQLADALQMTTDEIREYNPSFRKDIIPFTNAKIPLTLPYDKVIQFTKLTSDSSFKTHLDENLIAYNKQVEFDRLHKNSKPKTVIYSTKHVEFLTAIADKFDVTVKQLKQWNHTKSNKIAAGKKLKIKVNQG